MINLTDYKELLGENVIVSCTDGKNITNIEGLWSDCLYAEDAEDDNVQEDAVMIDLESGSTVCIYVSEIKNIEEA